MVVSIFPLSPYNQAIRENARNQPQAVFETKGKASLTSGKKLTVVITTVDTRNPA